MSINNISVHPHVEVSTRVRMRTTEVVRDERTALFVPLATEYGPLNQVVEIGSQAEFISIFGEFDEVYALNNNSQTVLNLANWLLNGRAFVYRIGSGYDYASATTTLDLNGTEYILAIKAKYQGAMYNGWTARFSRTLPGGPITMVVFKDNAVEDSITISASNFSKIFNSSRYIAFDNTNTMTYEALNTYLTAPNPLSIELELGENPSVGNNVASTAGSGTPDLPADLVSLFNAFDTIVKKDEYPIDVVLDGMYPDDVKQAILNLAADRQDILFVLDTLNINTGTGAVTDTSIVDFGDNHNVSVYRNQRLVEEASIVGKDIFVSPTYYYALNLPFNDNEFGVQWPTAGVNRGNILTAKQLISNLSTSDKEQSYLDRLNYIEKDSRGMYFMSQLTRAAGNTPLRFVNNVRSLNVIIRDLERIGKEYLFEFNDNETLKNMKSRLTRELGTWIDRRVLSYGLLDVAKDDFSDERVRVTLNIRFTGTIEVISVDITIE